MEKAEGARRMARATEPLQPGRRGLLAAAFTATVGAFLPKAAQAEQKPAADLSEPLGICLEGWPYPGPVEFLPLEMAGEPVRMAYMDFQPEGAGNGRAILLLHGKNFDSSYWAGPIAFLRRAGFRVVVPDQIGFNKSSKPLCAYTFDALAAHTLALADFLGVKDFALLGHSTGGMLAVRLASLAPERISRLLLEDPIGLIDYRLYIPPQSLATLEAAERAQTPESYRAFVARYFPKLPPADYEPFVAWRLRMAGSGDYPRFLRVVALTYLMIYQNPVRGFFARLNAPVLLMAGDQDHGVPLLSYASPEMRGKIPGLIEAAREVVLEIPDGKLVEFAGLGHVPHLEAPEQFEKAVLGFLATEKGR
jgi:pimeloyl-ACP methyl ester carboxylesterase